MGASSASRQGESRSGQKRSRRDRDTPMSSGTHGTKVLVCAKTVEIPSAVTTNRKGYTPAPNSGSSSPGMAIRNSREPPACRRGISSSAPGTGKVSGGVAAASVTAPREMKGDRPSSNRTVMSRRFRSLDTRPITRSTLSGRTETGEMEPSVMSVRAGAACAGNPPSTMNGMATISAVTKRTSSTATSDREGDRGRPTARVVTR